MDDKLVVVGVDGSPTSSTALQWALATAGRTGAAVQALQSWRWDAAAFGMVAPEAPAGLAVDAQRSAEDLVGKALADRPAGSPEVPTRARAVEGETASVLLAASTGAALLVLGRHGRSFWRRALPGPALGSVTAHCLNRATVPVAVIPPDASTEPPTRVVVGVDGSASSVRALRWAAAHAAVVGAPVVAVHTWQLTTVTAPPSARTGGFMPPLPEWEEQARTVLEQAVTAAVPADQAPAVERLLLHRPPSAGLLSVLQPDDLLVLGERGRGGFDRLLLGSVSRQCVEHAPCPVVVVPSRTATA